MPMFFLSVAILSVVLSLFTICAAVLPGVRSTGWRISLSLLTLLIAFKFHILYLIGGGNFFVPNIPGWLQLFSSALYQGLLIFAPLLAAALLLRALLWLLPRWLRPEGAELRSCYSLLLLVLAITSLGISAIGTRNAMKYPEVNEVSISLPHLPADTPPLRIVHLADTHADALAGEPFMRHVVERTNELRPDLVVITGDFADGSPDERRADLQPLSELRARYGVYGVSGNHDLFADYKSWQDLINSLGVRLLENEHILLPHHPIVLAGVPDLAIGRLGYVGLEPDLNKTLAGAPLGYPVILMAHQPRFAPAAERAGVALQLSGHTHGGMMKGLLHTLIAHMNEGYAEGLYRKGDFQIYVSRGTGLWRGSPLRLGVPAEITLITITGEKAQKN